MPACRSNDIEQRRRFFDETRLDRVTRLEHEFQTFDSARQCDRTNNDDDQHQKQSRHADFVEFLNTVRNLTFVDEIADQQEQQRKDRAAERVGQHRAEGRAAFQIDGKELLQTEAEFSKIQRQVLHAVTAEYGIEAQNQEWRKHGEPADPAELLRNLVISADRTEFCLAAQSQLRGHDDETDKDC